MVGEEVEVKVDGAMEVVTGAGGGAVMDMGDEVDVGGEAEAGAGRAVGDLLFLAGVSSGIFAALVCLFFLSAVNTPNISSPSSSSSLRESEAVDSESTISTICAVAMGGWYPQVWMLKVVWGGESQMPEEAVEEEDCLASQASMPCRSPRFEPSFGTGWLLGR